MRTSREGKRGCGFRKPGGLYLVSKGLGAACDKLPVPVEVCPTCGCGIKVTRGFTWIDPSKLAADVPCKKPHCRICPLGGQVKKAGLLWIGERYYKQPEDWEKEVMSMGASRRIHTIPRGFVIGETWVLVAHRKVYMPDAGKPATPTKSTAHVNQGKEQDALFYRRAIFHAFKPDAVEYVVKGDETKQELKDLEKRGITPVKVVKLDEKGKVVREGGKRGKRTAYT